MTHPLTSPYLGRRVLWAYCIYLVLVVLAFGIGFWWLPRGVFLATPITFLGRVAGQPSSLLSQYVATVGFNLLLAFGLGAGLNLQRVRGLPTGYVFLFVQGFISGLIAGTNSFANPVISPYTREGWWLAFRIQHLEMLGYALIIASTVAIGLWDYSDWLPWRARETRLKTWRAIRLTRGEVLGILLGVVVIGLAGFNETMMGEAV